MEPQQHGPAGHWSASNPIPTIQKFLEGQQQDRQERDRQALETQRQKEQEDNVRKQHREKEDTDAAPHTAPIAPRSAGRRVRDPTTGRDIEIDDVGKEFMKAATDPQVLKNFSSRTSLNPPVQEFDWLIINTFFFFF